MASALIIVLQTFPCNPRWSSPSWSLDTACSSGNLSNNCWRWCRHFFHCLLCATFWFLACLALFHQYYQAHSDHGRANQQSNLSERIYPRHRKQNEIVRRYERCKMVIEYWYYLTLRHDGDGKSFSLTNTVLSNSNAMFLFPSMSA